MTDYILILKLKTRWKRWLGQVTREDKPYWADLLNCNWIRWANSVLVKRGEFNDGESNGPDMTRESVKEYFHKAILFSSLEDLYRLDELYLQKKMERHRE